MPECVAIGQWPTCVKDFKKKPMERNEEKSVL